MEEMKKIFWLETAENQIGTMELHIRPLFHRQEAMHIALELIGEQENVWEQGDAWKQEITLQPQETEAVFPCRDVNRWEPEAPVLYQARISYTCGGEEGLYGQLIGFRSLEKKGKVVYWNHNPLKLRGICYRERKDDWEGTQTDLELFAKAHVNFLRSIYGPFSQKMLELCDRMGFLVENTAPFYDIGQSGKVHQDLPHLQEEFMVSVREMLAEGSHVSVLIWSLGHDCAWGANFRAAAEYIRSYDRVRMLCFHLPMSIPEEEQQMDVWPVHYIDWRQPFDVCYDQMVIFHTPGAENEIGYMTGQAEYELPVLHEIWSPVACHNRNEIQQNEAIRDFWKESIWRFVEKAYATEGCLGGAVLAGVDEDGSFMGMDKYQWGILDKNHRPKPEYYHLQRAYARKDMNRERKDFPFTPAKKEYIPLVVEEAVDGELIIYNNLVHYTFHKGSCLLKEAKIEGKTLLTGGPYLNCTGLSKGKWIGRELTAEYVPEGVQLTIRGGYENTLDMKFVLLIRADGTLDTCYEIEKLYRHMPHTVKADTGMTSGGLNEKGVSYMLAWDKPQVIMDGELLAFQRALITCKNGGGILLSLEEDGALHLEKEPGLTQEAIVNDRDPRMVYAGSWYQVTDDCGNRQGTETVSRQQGDTMKLCFQGTGVSLYGPMDINNGCCNIYVDGVLMAEQVSQYPDKVDFPGMSRGYEKRYGQLLACIQGLEEGHHELVVKVLGTGAPGAQNTYTAIDYAVLEGDDYAVGTRMSVNSDYNFSRLVRGCYKRPKVELIPGERLNMRMRLFAELEEEV